MNKDQIQTFYNEVYQSYSSSQHDAFDQYERNLVLKRLYQPSQPTRILDLGAGDGTISQFFARLGYEVYALEWTEAGVQKLNELGIKASQHDIRVNARKSSCWMGYAAREVMLSRQSACTLHPCWLASLFDGYCA